MVDSMVHCVCICSCPNCIFEFLSLCMHACIHVCVSLYVFFCLFLFLPPLSFSLSSFPLPPFRDNENYSEMFKGLRERERGSSLYSSIIVSITHTSRFISLPFALEVQIPQSRCMYIPPYL